MKGSDMTGRARVAAVAFAAAIVLGGAAIAGEAKCKTCRDLDFITSIGKCGKCGKHTSSGAFKLCKSCAVKANSCQACGRSLKAEPKKEKPRIEARRQGIFIGGAGGPMRGKNPGFQQPSKLPAGLKAGEAVKGLKLTVTTAKKTYKRGDKIPLKLTFENVSKEKMRVSGYALSVYKLRAFVKGKASQAARMIEFSMRMAIPSDFAELKPGGKKSYDILAIKGKHPTLTMGRITTTLDGTGEYGLTFVYTARRDHVDFGENGKRGFIEGQWTGSVASNELKFTLKQ